MFFSLGKVKSVGILSGAPLPIAIDFGFSALKVLQLMPGDPPSLLAAASLQTPEELLYDSAKRLPFQFAALPRLLKASGASFKGKRAVCSIPAGQMFVKHIQFPRSEAVDYGALVQAAVPAALGCHPDALLYRHVVVEEATPPAVNQSPGAPPSPVGPRTEVICLASSRELVRKAMEAVHACRLEVVGIHPEFLAALRAFDHMNRRTGDEKVSTLYLDIGCGCTKLSIAHGRDLVFAKVVHIGGNDLDHAAARSLDCTLTEARKRRLAVELVCPANPGRKGTAADRAHGPVHSIDRAIAHKAAAGEVTLSSGDSGIFAAAVEDDRREGRTPAPGLTPPLSEQPPADPAPSEIDLREPLASLTGEIAMCLRYYESIFPGRRVNRAIFFGGESAHRGLCQHIARMLKLPAQVADPLARVARTGQEPLQGLDLSSPQPGWTVPFGLSLCPTDL